MHEYRTRRRIEFADTDMAGIVHFARFFAFMETVEHEFLRSLGTPVHFDLDGHEVGWPRIAASCEYRSPAKFGDVLDIHLTVVRKGRRAMTYGFLFTCGDRLVAEGQISSIFCSLPWKPALGDSADHKPQPLAIPSFLADQIEEAPKSAQTKAKNRA